MQLPKEVLDYDPNLAQLWGSTSWRRPSSKTQWTLESVRLGYNAKGWYCYVNPRKHKHVTGKATPEGALRSALGDPFRLGSYWYYPTIYVYGSNWSGYRFLKAYLCPQADLPPLCYARGWSVGFCSNAHKFPTPEQALLDHLREEVQADQEDLLSCHASAKQSRARLRQVLTMLESDPTFIKGQT